MGVGGAAGFPSAEWLERYVEVLNKSEVFAKSTKGWVWVILFVVREEDPEGEEGFILDIADGRCVRHLYLGDAKGANAPYRVWAPRQVWLDLLYGRLDPIRAIGQAKVGLSANQATLGRFTETVKVLLEHLKYTV